MKLLKSLKIQYLKLSSWSDKFKHHKTDQAHQYSLGISLLISCIFTVGATVLEEEGDQQKFTQSIYTAFKRGFEKINKEKNKKDE